MVGWVEDCSVELGLLAGAQVEVFCSRLWVMVGKLVTPSADASDLVSFSKIGVFRFASMMDGGKVVNSINVTQSCVVYYLIQCVYSLQNMSFLHPSSDTQLLHSVCSFTHRV